MSFRSAFAGSVRRVAVLLTNLILLVKTSLSIPDGVAWLCLSRSLRVIGNLRCASKGVVRHLASLHFQAEPACGSPDMQEELDALVGRRRCSRSRWCWVMRGSVHAHGPAGTRRRPGRGPQQNRPGRVMSRPGRSILTWVKVGFSRKRVDHNGKARYTAKGLPLIWFYGIASGLYLPRYPAWLVADEPVHLQFVVALDEVKLLLPVGAAAAEADRRRYADRLTRLRLHQPVFRARVLTAYQGQCSICRLRYTELLDGRAHPARRTPTRTVRGTQRSGPVQDPPRRLRPQHPRGAPVSTRRTTWRTVRRSTPTWWISPVAVQSPAGSMRQPERR